MGCAAKGPRIAAFILAGGGGNGRTDLALIYLDVESTSQSGVDGAVYA